MIINSAGAAVSTDHKYKPGDKLTVTEVCFDSMIVGQEATVLDYNPELSYPIEAVVAVRAIEGNDGVYVFREDEVRPAS